MKLAQSTTDKLIHLTGIACFLASTLFLIRTLFATGEIPSQLATIYLRAIPLSLFMQSLLVLSVTKTSPQSRKWRCTDAFLSVVTQITAILILSFSEFSDKLVFTGLFISLLMVIRGAFILSIITRHASRMSDSALCLFTSLAVVLLLLPHTSWRIAMRPLMGDEPYYLLITHSILHDKDINLENNYLDGDSLNYTENRLAPQEFDNYTDDKLMSRHPPFLPLLLMPGFVLAGSAGAIYSLLAFSALLTTGLIRLLLHFDVKKTSAIWAASVCALSAPMIFYSYAIFTELPGAVIGVFAVGVSIDIYRKKRFSIPLAVLIILAGVLLKTRFVSLCLPPVLLGILLRERIWKRIWRWLVFATLFIGMLGVINAFMYGSALGRYGISDLIHVSHWRLFRGLLGQFWDQQYGLFPLNPLYLLAVPGIWFCIKTCSRPKFLIWISAILPYYIIVALYAELSGGICFRGRFLVAWVALLTLPAAICLQRLKGNLATWIVAILSSLYFSVSLFWSAFPEWQIISPGGADQTLTHLSKSLNLDLLHIIPSFDRVDHALVRSGIFLASLAGLFTLFVVLSDKWSLTATRKRAMPLYGWIGITIIIFYLPISILLAEQTSWMEVEDGSFSFSGQTRLFWEEPFGWDSNYSPSLSPYRSGAKVYTGGSVTRLIPLRPPADEPDMKMVLEIVCRGSYPDPKVPILEVLVGDKVLGQIQIRSTQFESYRIPWPYGLLSEIPLVTLRHVIQDSDSVFIDIDKLRLATWNHPWPMAIGNDRHFFPVQIDQIRVNSMSFPQEPVVQGMPFTINTDFSVDGSTSHIEPAILFLSGTKAHIFSLEGIDLPQANQITVTIPPEIGTGRFEAFVYARKKEEPREFVTPDGLSIFRSGKRTWVGYIQISALPVPSSGEWTDTLTEILGRETAEIHVLPENCHLSGFDTIELPLNQPENASGLAVISHLTSVFEEIPWETVIAEIEAVSTDKSYVFPAIIGRHTAEAMYEFPAEGIRLAHPQAPIAGRQKQTLHWPLEFEGIEYTAVYYYALYDFEEVSSIETLHIKTFGFPGVWNIYAVALLGE